MTEGKSPFSSVPGGILVRLKVTPNAAQRSVHGVFAEGHGAVLKVGVTAAPEGGKANTAVINLLAWE